MVRSYHTLISYRSPLDRRYWNGAGLGGAVRAELDCQHRNKQIRGRVAQKAKRRAEAYFQLTSLSPKVWALMKGRNCVQKTQSSGIWISTERLDSSWLRPLSFPAWKQSSFQVLFILNLSKIMT